MTSASAPNAECHSSTQLGSVPSSGSKEALLEAFGAYEQANFDAGLAAAIKGLDKAERLEAVLRFIVEFQQTSSLRVVVAVEPEYVLREMTRVLPITRDRLLAHFPGPDGSTVASIITRIALSHALVPDDDPDLFLDELRRAAGLDGARARPGRQRTAKRTPSRRTRAMGR